MNLITENPYRPYRGEALRSAVNLTHKTLSAYFPDQGLPEVVELARVLQRPLLLKGEPGSGKTCLAEAIAYEMYHDKYKDYFHAWHIKSTTKAKEGLYTFDQLRRLRDSTLKEEKDIESYVTYGPLGSAIRGSTAKAPHIVLIDEIDKADIDFPNDLLLELDEKQFKVQETNKVYPDSKHTFYPPIIIITSNNEKELPAAFLRRCIFHYIEFPGEKVLSEIVNAKLEHELKTSLPKPLISAILNKFQQLHDVMKDDPNVGSIPSTSSLLDWVKAVAFGVLERKEFSPDEFVDKLKNGELPYAGVLLKTLEDFDKYKGQ